ncbi:ATP-binding cassette domain-containing protein [Sphingomonas sp. 28-63-12]|uniref:ATP-binding cassette domain-containing protein n=1 Tax=Sphingomonas sp. 28-63-12 TaxID=1970434 RepID=UPI000BC7BDB9|nr:MAG: ABC transporter [Sphingomonas sp. 28-63-12]
MKPPLSPIGFGLGERRTLRWALICALLAGLSSILLLALSGWFLTAAAVAGTAGGAAVLAFNYLLPSAAIRALAIIRTGSRYGERLLAHRAALLGMATLRADLFGKLAAQDSRVAEDLSGGDASARLIGDIAALEDLVVRRPTRPASLAAALFAIGLTGFAGWASALVLALMLGALPLLLAIAAKRMTAAPAHAAADALGALRTRFVDLAAARPEIIAYGLADRVIADLEEHAVRLDQARAALFRGEGVMAALMLAYGALSATLVLAIAAQGPAAGIALALLAATASVESMAAFARTALRQASVDESLIRLAALIALPDRVTPAVPLETKAAAITLGAVQLAPGSRIAITGASGSGKTRLIEALAGMRPAIHAIAINGVAVADCSADRLRAQVALSPQDAMLIAGTITDNLRLARPRVTPAQMHAALAVACLDGRVAVMPAGLDTRLGDDGGSLSGGERKRLSLARALLAGRPWLVLDEPTEGLDPATEAEVIARLCAWLDTTGTGLILVSHRPAPLALADRRIAIAQIGLPFTPN